MCIRDSIKASLERKFSIGLKLSINTWTKDRKILAGHIACFAKRWPIVDDADVVMFEEPALVFFYIGFFSAKHETVEVTKGAYTVHASVGQHALVRMLQREATIPEEFPKIAVQALKIAAFLADISEAHSGFKKSNYWKKTHTIAVPFKGGALILVSHFLGPAFAGYSKRNYSVRTWLSSDQLSIEVKQSMKGWSELSKNGRLESDSDYLENIFLPKDFYYD